MADNHRLVHFVFSDINCQIFPYSFKERRFNARLTRETGQRQDVAFVSVFVAGHGGVPGFAGRRESGDENHWLSFADDVHVEGWRRRLSVCGCAK